MPWQLSITIRQKNSSNCNVNCISIVDAFINFLCFSEFSAHLFWAVEISVVDGKNSFVVTLRSDANRYNARPLRSGSKIKISLGQISLHKGHYFVEEN